jgi:Putative treble-clef, zinc-finger, Zn-binding
MPNDARVRALLGDLGRATLRGVRKCPKCGTYNGTRGSSCKNRACDVVFNNRGLADKQNKPIDACKLITGGSNQVLTLPFLATKLKNFLF